MLRPLIGVIALFCVAGEAPAATEIQWDSSDQVKLHDMELPVAKAVEKAAEDRFSAYVHALQSRDYQAAYTMLRLSFQAANHRLEWEMKLRARDTLWADGTIRVLRESWYRNPSGQPVGLYSAYDFRADRTDGGMDCGYVVLHQATEGADFSVVRTDTNYVPASLMKEGVPEVGVLRQLPCFLGKGIATAM